MKSYLSDINRLHQWSSNQIKRYQDKQIQKVLRYASTVPIYKKLYQKNHCDPSRIKQISDLSTLPLITKEDMNQYGEVGKIPKGRKPGEYVQVGTSGTTGKSLTIYVDMFDIVIGLFGYLRSIREYGINWRTHRLSIIGDFAEHTAESGYVNRGLLPNSWFRSLFQSIQWLDTNDSPEKVLTSLNEFQPDFIGGYTGMLGHLAVLKSKGFGKQVNPRLIASTGAILDPPLKTFIEDSFNTTVFEVYGATETGPIAFQCQKKRIYHIMSDLLYLEFLDKDNQPVSSRKPGRLVVTKLYGGGTPIIRYDAINDIVAPLYETHHCGVAGGLIDRIYGRDSIRLYRRDGKIVLPSAFTTIFSRLLYEYQTSKIRDLKVTQKDLYHIDVQVVLDEKSRNEPPSFSVLQDIIMSGFHDKFGDDVQISVAEVTVVKRDEPRVISHVDPKTLSFTGYL